MTMKIVWNIVYTENCAEIAVKYIHWNNTVLKLCYKKQWNLLSFIVVPIQRKVYSQINVFTILLLMYATEHLHERIQRGAGVRTPSMEYHVITRHH